MPPIAVPDWQRCLDYFNHRCAVCGNPAGLWHVIVADHWKALSKEGTNTRDNIIPLCHSKPGGAGGCNNSKQSRDAEQWLIECYGKRKAAAILKRIQVYFEWVKQQ